MSPTSIVIRSVVLRNFKSIAACRVELGPLTFLVGANGSGKSNFLHSLLFVAESLGTSLDLALRGRGTIREVRRRSGGHPNHFAIRLDFSLPGGEAGHFSFRIGAKSNGGYQVQSEECRVLPAETDAPEAYYHVSSGTVIRSSQPHMPASFPDRLHLVAASGLPEFRKVYDALSSMQVYNLNPQQIGTLQSPDSGDLLRHDGGNAASVLQRIDPAVRDRLDDYLGRIVPGLESVRPRTLGHLETIEFRQRVRGQQHPWQFPAASMSDGTLRALGVLLAIHQTKAANGLRLPSLIGLEEPETALHPAATAVLLAALREASHATQIVVTSHSPDLLDNPDIDPMSLYAVDNDDGLTRIGRVDAAGRESLRERLFTAGELLRLNQLAPEAQTLSDVRSESQLRLFDLDGVT